MEKKGKKSVHKRYKYNQEGLFKAYEAYKKGVGIRRASLKYGGPYMTLYQKLKENNPGKRGCVGFTFFTLLQPC